MSLHALVEKWRADADKIGAHVTAPTGLTWDHGACDALRKCAEELAAALAGGGEAVAWLVLYGDRVVGYVTHESKPYATLAEGETLVPVFTHPAGAVQVTDELVNRAMTAHADEMESQDRAEALPLMDRLHECMRAALNAAINPGGSRD